MTNTKYLMVGLFNAGSLGTRHKELLAAMIDVNVDLIAINETWIREGEEEHAPAIPGHQFRHNPRSLEIKGGRGGGVGFSEKTTEEDARVMRKIAADCDQRKEEHEPV
ncbi:unnamed protein product [Danaus chrysippus]|uniref:(African queen) hypothetical protein n=1 Tax=Danaus chrysippus TaxID=151541 RepID=A0A8J2QW90_9NEOP|nr:unnamed protein product [Danaus chrysippus]